MKNIVTIGGGSGQPVVLRALKKIKGIKIKAIVTTLDNGGSTGKLSRELDILPVGDLIKCAFSLSPFEKDLAAFWGSRLISGKKLPGHTPGNLLLAMMIKHEKDFCRAFRVFCRQLEIQGEIIPVSLNKTVLVAKYENGKTLRGEHNIDEAKKNDHSARINILKIKPVVPANPAAILALRQADYIFIGPGDVYTSILPNFLFPEIGNTLKSSRAKIGFFMNLMTKKGQTRDMGARAISLEIERYLHRRLDAIFINNQQIPKNILREYKKEGEEPIPVDFFDKRIVCKPLLSNKKIVKDKNDFLNRSILKHDSLKVEKLLEKIIF